MERSADSREVADAAGTGHLLQDRERALLRRAVWATRAELTTVLGEIRGLERQERGKALERVQADRLRTLRTRESQLHFAMAARTAVPWRLRARVAVSAEVEPRR